MNCTVDWVALLQLLQYLELHLPSRQIIVHSTQPSAFIELQAAQRNSSPLMLSYTADTADPTIHTVHVFLPGFADQKRAFYVNKAIYRAVLIFVADECDQAAKVPPVGISLRVQLTPSSSNLNNYQLQRRVPFTTNKMTVGAYSPEEQTWKVDMQLSSEFPLRPGVLRGIQVSIMLTSRVNMSIAAAARAFSRTSAAQYWSVLFDYFKFTLDFKILLVDGNNINRIINQFLRARYDALSSLYIVDSDRIEKLSFVSLGLQVKYHLIVRRPQYEWSWLGLTKPLARGSWISIVFNIIAVSCVLHLLFRYATHSPYNTSFPATFFMVLGLSCNQANLKTLLDMSLQIACMSTLLYFFIINQFYVSNLYSILSTKEINYPFDSLEEFLEKDTHQLIINPETAAYRIFRSATSQTEHELATRYIEGQPQHKLTPNNTQQQLARVCAGTAAIFALPLQMADYSTPQCPLQFVPEGYYPMDMAITVRPDFPYLALFRILYMKATEAGISRYLNEKYFLNAMLPISRRNSATDPNPVSLYQVLFPFAILSGGLVIAVILLAAEVLWSDPLRPCRLLSKLCRRLCCSRRRRQKIQPGLVAPAPSVQNCKSRGGALVFVE